MQSSPFTHDSVQNCFKQLCGRLIIFDPTADFSRRKRRKPDISLLSFPWQNSEALHSLDPPTQTFRAMTHHVTHRSSNHPYAFLIPLVSRKSHSERFCSGRTTFCNWLRSGWFPDRYTLSLFQSSVNPFSILPILIIFTFVSYVHTTCTLGGSWATCGWIFNLKNMRMKVLKKRIRNSETDNRK